MTIYKLGRDGLKKYVHSKFCIKNNKSYSLVVHISNLTASAQHYYYYYYLPLCRTLIFTCLKQTTFLGYIVLQPFCSYNLRYI
jgi:hypothetical protein